MVAMETGETVADGRRCALGASDLPLLNIHTSCTHSTHAFMLSCFVFFFFLNIQKTNKAECTAALQRCCVHGLNRHSVLSFF